MIAAIGVGVLGCLDGESGPTPPDASPAPAFDPDEPAGVANDPAPPDPADPDPTVADALAGEAPSAVGDRYADTGPVDLPPADAETPAADPATDEDDDFGIDDLEAN